MSFAFGCKKEFLDYRDKFCGEYNFFAKEEIVRYLGGGNYSRVDTSYEISGKILPLKETENMIKIILSDSVVFNVQIDIDGSFKRNYRCCNPLIYLIGEFESTKTIKFEYKYASNFYSDYIVVTGNK